MKALSTHVLVLLVGIALGAVGMAMLAPHADSPKDAAPLRDGQHISTSNETATFSDEMYRFSLSYPKAFPVTQYDEGGGSRTLVFQGGEQEGFQLFITPYEGEQIGKDRIASDLAGAPMKEVKDIVIGNGVPAVLFTSESPSIGETREVWFLHGGYLFDATTYSSYEEAFAKIINTISFK